MAFVNLNTVTVDCELIELDGGVAESGTVSFAAPKMLFDIAGSQIITPTPITRSLGSGDAMLSIPASDDPDITSMDNAPWTYSVTISVTGGRQTFTAVPVPVAYAGTTVSLVSLLAASASYVPPGTPPQPPGQSVPFSPTLTVDSLIGETVKVGALTGAMTVAAPLHPVLGRSLTFLFYQDATGGRVVSWNAVFRSPPPVDTTPSSLSVVTFLYDGSQWV